MPSSKLLSSSQSTGGASVTPKAPSRTTAISLTWWFNIADHEVNQKYREYQFEQYYHGSRLPSTLLSLSIFVITLITIFIIFANQNDQQENLFSFLKVFQCGMIAVILSITTILQISPIVPSSGATTNKDVTPSPLVRFSYLPYTTLPILKTIDSYSILSNILHIFNKIGICTIFNEIQTKCDSVQ